MVNKGLIIMIFFIILLSPSINAKFWNFQNFSVNISQGLIVQGFNFTEYLYNQTENSIYYYNQTENSIYFYNQTLNSIYYYNQTSPLNPNATLLTANNITDFNNTVESITASTTYLPDNFLIVDGTFDVGNITSIQFANEKGALPTLNVSEDNGADPLTIQINFTDVQDFNTLLMNVWYQGVSGHEIAIGIWEWDDSKYEEEYGEIDDMNDMAFINIGVFDPSEHISEDGNVSVQLRHIDNGNTQHDLIIDYLVLIDGYTAQTTSEHDALSGRENINNHPWAVDSLGRRNVSGSLTISGSLNATNLTSKWIYTDELNVGAFNFSAFAYNQTLFSIRQFQDSFDANLSAVSIGYNHSLSAQTTISRLFTDWYNQNFTLTGSFNFSDFQDSFDLNVSSLTFGSGSFNASNFQDSYNLNFSLDGSFNFSDFQDSYNQNFSLAGSFNFSDFQDSFDLNLSAVDIGYNHSLSAQTTISRLFDTWWNLNWTATDLAYNQTENSIFYYNSTKFDIKEFDDSWQLNWTATGLDYNQSLGAVITSSRLFTNSFNNNWTNHNLGYNQTAAVKKIFAFDSGVGSCALDNSYIGQGYLGMVIDDSEIIMPYAITVSGMYCQLEIADGDGLGTFTLYDDGGGTAITCATAGSGGLTCSQSGQSVAIASGSLLTIHFEETDVSTSGHCGCSIIYNN